MSTTATPTLADVERETASRLGPYYDLVATGGTATAVVVAGLRTNAEVGGLEGLYLVRREAVRPDDRVRTVERVDGPSGSIVPDFPYQDAPQAGERVELHHLHPDLQLLLDVKAALRRCYLLDTLVVTPPPEAFAAPEVATIEELGRPNGNGNGWVIWPTDGRNGANDYALVPATGAYVPVEAQNGNGPGAPVGMAGMAGVTERAARAATSSVADLTAQAFWLTAARQVLAVASEGVPLQPRRYGSAGWACYASRGRLYLSVPAGTPLDGITVRAYRDAYGLRNGVDAPTGPAADDDELAVPLDYAAAFAHIEAWRRHRDRLEAAAAEGRFATQQEAGTEATRVAALYADWLFRPQTERGDVPATAMPMGSSSSSAGGLGGTGALAHAVVNQNDPYG